MKLHEMELMVLNFGSSPEAACLFCFEGRHVEAAQVHMTVENAQ